METEGLADQAPGTLSAPLDNAPAAPASPTGSAPDETGGASDAAADGADGADDANGADGADSAAGEGEGEPPRSDDDDGDGGAGSNNDDSEEDKYIAPILDGREITLKLSTVSAHIRCGLCTGYLIDATTIAECMHAFCRSCIYKHFNASESCPVCGTTLTNNPLEQLRQDRTLQSIVYKLVPTLKAREEQLKNEFYQRRNMKRPADDQPEAPPPPRRGATSSRTQSRAHSPPPSRAPPADAPAPHPSFTADEPQIAFFLVPDESRRRTDSAAPALKELEKPYVKTSSKATVLHLKKYLCKKLNLGRASDLDILCNGEILGQEHSLEFVKRTRWSGKTDQLVLHYRPTIERY